MTQLRVFLSYSSEDKFIAGKYKESLEKYYGFKVFVAHDDNIPSLEWGPEIKDNISKADIFIVLVSINSKKSEFVNQEIGIAIALNIRIFPIKIDSTNPFGFIYKIHGFPFIKDNKIGLLTNGTILFSILTSDRSEFKILGELAIDSAIYALSKSPNWVDSNRIIKTLLGAESQKKFNQKQINLLCEACNNNYEVYGGAFEYESLKQLLEKRYDIRGLK
jgi:hypothetical protein